jgi:branched-chain amino acid transport system ATP-binding protein
VLNVQDIHVYYGDSHILFEVSLEVKEREIVCLLGRNGAGKTTTLRSIIGLVPPKEGRIEFDGKDITHEPIFKRSKMGIGYVPEDRGLFPRLTVRENLNLAVFGTGDSNGLAKALNVFPVLEKYLNTPAGNLSGGEQQMLAIGRGLIGNKKLILLDECSQGLAPKIVRSISEALLKIKKETSILLVEQNVRFALNIADRVYIMRDGHIVFKGEPEEVRENKAIQDYLVVA